MKRALGSALSPAGVILPLLILATGPAAQAASVPFKFTGKVDAVIGTELSSIASLGDRFVIHFNVETSTADGSADSGVGRYANAVTDFSFEVGSYTGSSAFPLTFLVTNDFGDGRDAVEVVTRNLSGAAVGPYTMNEFRLQLVDRTGTAFDSDALPASQIDPADFDDPLGFTYISLTFDHPADPRPGVISAELNPSPVPVPASFWLMFSGLAALFRGRTRALPETRR